MALPQGTLNRLRGFVAVTDFPDLSIDYQQLGAEGIRLSFEDNATDILPTMSGTVTSPKPYQSCTLTISVVKTATIGNVYKNQFTLNTLIGQIVIYPDTQVSNSIAGPGEPVTTALDPFILNNMALENIREMSFAGTEAALLITLRGYYIVNTFLVGNAL